METQADAIREAIAGVLKAAKGIGAVEVVFRAEDVSQAIVGSRSNHPNVIRALMSEKMKAQTGFPPGTSDRGYDSSSARISFKL